MYDFTTKTLHMLDEKIKTHVESMTFEHVSFILSCLVTDLCSMVNFWSLVALPPSCVPSVLVQKMQVPFTPAIKGRTFQANFCFCFSDPSIPSSRHIPQITHVRPLQVLYLDIHRRPFHLPSPRALDFSTTCSRDSSESFT